MGDKIWKRIVILIVASMLLLFYWTDPLGLFHRKPEEVIVEEKQQEVVEEFQRMSEEELQTALENAEVGDFICYGVFENKEYLQWKVLDKEDGKIFVISDSLLTVRPFNDRQADDDNKFLTVTWANSDVRAWLNDEIYHSIFNAMEQERILETEVVTQPATQPNLSGEIRDGGENTLDKLFLLSSEEVREFMPYADSRVPSNEIYLISGYKDGMSYTAEIIREEPGTEYEVPTGVAHLPVDNWWLRSPGDLGFHIQTFDTNFEIDENGTSVLSELGIRPAMWISY